MYRLYECNYQTGEETFLCSSNVLSECVRIKERLIKDSVSRGDRYDKNGRVRKTYIIAGEEGTPYLQALL